MLPSASGFTEQSSSNGNDNDVDPQTGRSSAGNQQAGERLNDQLILPEGRGSQGASYQWIDSSAIAGQSYQYWLEEQQSDGQIRRYGPISISPTSSNSCQVYLPFVSR